MLPIRDHTLSEVAEFGGIEKSLQANSAKFGA
jgi:hypothetical protein